MKEALIQELKAEFLTEQIFLNEPMSKHTTFRIGGPADVLFQPDTREQVQKIISICRKYDEAYYVIGNGSNLLVGDGGIRGVVIEFGNRYSNIDLESDESIRVQAGAMLSKAANIALQQAYTGMEFAAGIPGTIGGAVMMNAGAYGGEMKDIVEEVTLLTPDGEILTYRGEQMKFGYRRSIVSEKNYIVLDVLLKLKKGDKKLIQERMKELSEARKTKQPLNYPSAGSTFKRPEGYFAGKLIMDAGLAGYRVGDAEVSEKHCGFVINRGNASAKDIQELMNHVIDRVKELYDVVLEPEVRRVGEFI